MKPGQFLLLVLFILPALLFNRPVSATSEDSAASGDLSVRTAEDYKRPITAADLITLKEIGGTTGSGLSVSPDGSHVAFELHQANLATNDYDVEWFTGSIKTASPVVKVGNAGKAILFRSVAENGRVGGAWRGIYAKWSPDNRGIAYRKLQNGQIQIWWSSRNGADGPTQLTHNAADVEDFLWDPDGSRIFFTTDAAREERRNAGARQYNNGHVFDNDTDWSVIDGRPLYPPYELVGGEPVIWVLHLTSGIEARASARELSDYRKLIRQEQKSEIPPESRVAARDGNGHIRAWLAPITEKQGRGGPLGVFALAANGKDHIQCRAKACSGIFDLFRPLRKGIDIIDSLDSVLFARKAGESHSKRTLYRWQIGTDRVTEVLTTDDHISDCSVIDLRAICFRETPTQPRQIVSIDLVDGSIAMIFDPNPNFGSLITGDVELLEWTNATGYKAFGYLVKPPDYTPGRRYPLIVVGYRARTALRGGVGNEYPVHLFAANGFVVLVYERPTNHEAEQIISNPTDWSKAYWGPDLFDFRMPLSSFKAVIDLLSERELIDRSRVGVTGLSNGVGHVNYALIESDLFAAAVTSSSDFGPSSYFLVGSSDPIFRKHRHAIGLGRYGTPHGFLWNHISLSLNAEKVGAPLLVNASDSEHPRAIEEVTVLMEHGKPVEMIVYPDEGHIKWQPTHRASIYERNVDWFNFWLRNAIDSNPEKRAQYARWHDLRRKSDR
ncbi:MAG: Atxe2 family lasso peptide isopeptidase [Pseudomonadales bacterium]